MTRRILFSLVAVVGSVLGLQGSARADIYLELSDDSGGDTTVLFASGNLISFSSASSGAVGNFDVSFTAASSNAPGADQGRLDITNLVVSLVAGAAAGPHTLTIAAKATDFTLPPGSPLGLVSSVTTTFRNVNAGDSLAFKSFFDDGNTAPTTGASDLPSFMLGVGLANTTFVSGSGVQKSFSEDKGPIDVARVGSYALSNITTITISSTATTVNTTGASVVSSTVVPEPSSMALAGLGALGMIGYGLRRRVLGA